MSFMITAECVNCSACDMECPVRAISPAADQYLIDENVCIDCEGYFDVPRCKWVCPVNACVPQRKEYQHRASSLVNKGGRPVIYKKDGKSAGEMVSA